ncbi:MAG: recombinase family protein [Cutibacterium granulosum]|uniref:recombinase family protein n=1 Tax=Cutibacterium granulosum TaxID=33011 RepID=UPI002B229FA7|nr:recombinase family protein [Cutibacterium granulosum]MEA5658986.1 recombinase family protein [Cutibacterium granulosum]MEA5661447.1 recombinase family protein [Cutibacterium granulosum]
MNDSTVKTVRKLKEAGVEIFLEKENIWTLDVKGELLITIMSSLAQEESRSISENVTWGQRKRFANGKVTMPYSSFLGYDKDPDGATIINPEQVDIVRRIYHGSLQGATIPPDHPRPRPRGYSHPAPRQTVGHSTIRSILTTEKYKGDALLQKSFTVDFLTKTKRVNTGQVPQYYVTGSHEAIIDPEI